MRKPEALTQIWGVTLFCSITPERLYSHQHGVLLGAVGTSVGAVANALDQMLTHKLSLNHHRHDALAAIRIGVRATSLGIIPPWSIISIAAATPSSH